MRKLLCLLCAAVTLLTTSCAQNSGGSADPSASPAAELSEEERRIIDTAVSDLEGLLREKTNEKSYAYFDDKTETFVIGCLSDIDSLNFNMITEAANSGMLDITELRQQMNWDAVRDSMFALSGDISYQLSCFGIDEPDINLTLYDSGGVIAYMIFRNNVCTFDYLENFTPSS